jgi:two-component system, OmpR family, phosphate regulon sensor histidine kinase PhoR
MLQENPLDQLNVLKQCKRYGVSLWQCPQFLFLIMGIVIIITSVVSYSIGTSLIYDPETVILIVLGVAVILFVLSFIITRSFERLAEVSKMKSEFINIVSHQLRSPLTNIKWTFEILSSDDYDVPDFKQEEYFVNVRENIARMVELIDDLLIVSRIEQGKLLMAKKEFDFKELVSDQVMRYSIFAEASHIRLRFLAEEGFPKIIADPSLLKLVVENLIDNAIRYTKGRGDVMVAVKKRDSKNIIFIVKDSGVGIPEKEKKFIFQKFFRAENASKHRTKGSGLGLYVCKTIIEKSGGKIWFKSKENKGTTFFATLPIK